MSCLATVRRKADATPNVSRSIDIAHGVDTMMAHDILTMMKAESTT
jgi:hypothetical protein